MKKLGHMLKPLLPKFRSHLSFHLQNITEKQVPAKLKPIVAGDTQSHSNPSDIPDKHSGYLTQTGQLVMLANDIW